MQIPDDDDELLEAIRAIMRGDEVLAKQVIEVTEPDTLREVIRDLEAERALDTRFSNIFDNVVHLHEAPPKPTDFIERIEDNVTYVRF